MIVIFCGGIQFYYQGHAMITMYNSHFNWIFKEAYFFLYLGDLFHITQYNLTLQLKYLKNCYINWYLQNKLMLQKVKTTVSFERFGRTASKAFPCVDTATLLCLLGDRAASILCGDTSSIHLVKPSFKCFVQCQIFDLHTASPTLRPLLFFPSSVLFSSTESTDFYGLYQNPITF